MPSTFSVPILQGLTKVNPKSLDDPTFVAIQLLNLDQKCCAYIWAITPIKQTPGYIKLNKKQNLCFIGQIFL